MLSYLGTIGNFYNSILITDMLFTNYPSIKENNVKI